MSTHRPVSTVSLLILTAIFVLFIAPAPTAAQVMSGEVEALEAIRSMIRTAEPAEIIAKCDEFVEKYPKSVYITSIVQRVAELDPTSPRLLEYSRLAIANGGGTPTAYNNAAWNLYRAKAHLDTATVWAERALAVLPPNSRNARDRWTRAMLLDTLAHLVIEAGDADRAIRLMQEAVNQDGESYDYKLTLSELLCEAGRRDEAEEYLIDAVFLSPTGRTVRAAFNEYAADRVESEEEITAWKTNAVRRGVERYMEAGRGEPGLRARLANVLTDLEMLPDIALTLAEQAVAEDPEDPTALAALGAQLLKERRYDEAEKYLVEARLLSPQNHRARYEFDRLSQIRVLNGRDWFEYRASAFSAGIDRLMERLEDPLEFKKELAQTLKLLGVIPDRAMQLAREWAESTDPEKGLEEFMTSHVLCAQLALELGNAEEALNALEPVLHLASPADSELHRVRAEALRELGRPEEAIEVYVRVATIFPRAQVYMEPLQELWEETYGSERDLEAYLEERSTGAESWHPTGEYEIPDEWAGRMALAELFTGVNCPPCLSADIAYDHLRDYYPGEVLGILLYHLDKPVTNSDSEARKDYYNAEERLILGTPTSIINGTEVLLGGGPRPSVRSLFLKYSLQVEKDLLEAVPVEISLSGERSGNKLTVQSTVSITDPELHGNENIRMRIALAEKNVRYTGGNELPEHHWVVRSMIGGPKGFPLDTSQASTSCTADVDLAEVEADLRVYLEGWVADNYVGKKLEDVFDTSCLDIDETQLLFVAFVQDDSTHAILQAAVVELR